MLHRLAATTMAAAFSKWRQVAVRKARLCRQADQVSGRQQRLYKELAYGGWKEVVQWQASKRAADAHWRQVVQRSLLALWFNHAQKKAGYHKVCPKWQSWHVWITWSLKRVAPAICSWLRSLVI
jgi:hypothetical protein